MEHRPSEEDPAGPGPRLSEPAGTAPTTGAQGQPPEADELYTTFAVLVRAQTRLWNDVDAALRTRCSVSLADFTALQLVATTDRCRVQDIVTALHITVGGASKVVDRLERAGHLRRTANPEDRRSSILEVTASGRDLLRRARPSVDEVLTSQLGAVLPGHLLGDLERLLRAVEAAPPTPTRGTNP